MRKLSELFPLCLWRYWHKRAWNSFRYWITGTKPPFWAPTPMKDSDYRGALIVKKISKAKENDNA